MELDHTFALAFFPGNLVGVTVSVWTMPLYLAPFPTWSPRNKQVDAGAPVKIYTQTGRKNGTPVS